MKALINTVFFLLLSICTLGQIDTIYVDGSASLTNFFYSDNLQRLNIEKDLVYSINDSSLFSGYVVVADTFYYGNDKWQFSIKHIELNEGIGDIRYAATFQVDTVDQKENNWKKYETFKTDSSRTDYSFYPNGRVWTKKHQYFESDDVWPAVDSYYDTSGVLTRKIERLYGQVHVKVAILLSDSTMILLQYTHGNLDSVLCENILLFSIQNKKVTMSEFKNELFNEDLNWSIFINKTKEKEPLIILYSFDKSCSRNLLQEEICLTEKRKKKLIKKLK